MTKIEMLTRAVEKMREGRDFYLRFSEAVLRDEPQTHYQHEEKLRELTQFIDVQLTDYLKTEWEKVDAEVYA